MPVFTIAKPGTDEQCVLFDDSANNSLNMRAVGMQLPTLLKRALFLRNAKLLSSIDMASFFIQLRSHEDVADYWTFDCGRLGKVRTRRMVQGNSESPAIAQAFLLHVRSGAPSLRNKMLVYVDNIYLKSASGNEREHIADIGVFVWGRKWSANGDWKPFDHHMAALQSLPQPTTVSEIQHMNGGINTIVEHIPGLQFLLAPFYAATSKERLTRADNAELRQPWADLKQALLNAQYYWRKVCVVYEAVKYFYPYLDGCVNLRIETDCRMVVSLFVHKVDNDADQLAQFKLALTSMDIKKVMLVHRPGIKQETTDWLLRAKERLWPHKAPKGKADIEIGGKGVIYTIRYISASESENEDKSESENKISPAAEERQWTARAQGRPLLDAQLAVLENGLNLLQPNKYTECQQTDDKIQVWTALCIQCAEHTGELTPYFNVIA
ncbi:hypothetical protein GGF49_002014 [Coemansia sp. RSA 1853]|nr:hypothetical protein LPJ76_002748 [Coemansia sp. RSA 638]KAJ2543515.1 hypothetical protein GGF49_002014 [Coemansia sp. RSA 1853]